MSFDLARILRRLKPQQRAGTLPGRHDDDLPFIGDHLRPGPELVLDTTVYIDTLQGRSPPAIDALLAMRISNHSAVCLAELTHAFGRLDPAHPGTANALGQISEIILRIRPHRLSEPSPAAWGIAGMLAGLAVRLGRYGQSQERRLLNDALLYMHALERGHIVLTGNVRDFDILNQLLPEGRILLYRRDALAARR